MLRIYWNSKRRDAMGDSCRMVRTDGGGWFSEESESFRSVYKVITRKNKIEIDSHMLMEVLEEVSPDFIQSPCWQGAPLQRQLVRSEAPWSLWQILEEGSEQVLLVLSGPLQVAPPEWAGREVGPQNSAVLQQWLTTVSCAPPVSSGSTVPAQPARQHQEPREGSLLQKRPPPLPFAEKPPAQFRTGLSSSGRELGPERPPQPSRPVAAFGGQKVVQTGSLCPPMNLPDEQSPRMSPHRLPKHRQHPSPRHAANPPECLIDLSRS